MTKIKLCGLRRNCDIEWANALLPDYIGFIFAKASKRYVSFETARELKGLLDGRISAVGVFVNENIETVAALLSNDTIDIAQLHGNEGEEYIKALRRLTDKPIIKAFRIESEADIHQAENSCADFILLDSGGGTGTPFDWSLIQSVSRPYFLAGGLDCTNARAAIEALSPYAVDVSSGIETDGAKDINKMTEFIHTVRTCEERKRQ